MEVQSVLDISNFDISKTIVKTDSFFFHLHLNSCYFKLLIYQSKFSGTRKFTLRYQ